MPACLSRTFLAPPADPLRQAVGRAAVPDQNPHLRLGRRKDLVILHPHTDTATPPSGTQLWFNGRTLRSYHHIRMNVDADYARLARFLGGNSVGLVLSGGGARGMAHLGAIRALEDFGIPIDFVGGCSQGSFMVRITVAADLCGVSS